jgi:hypothetical protein
MTRRAVRTLNGAVAGLALVIGADRALAIEPGDFGQTVPGLTIGEPLAAPMPRGVYAFITTYLEPAGHGVGQNLGNNVTVPYWSPKVVWSTGFQILGANLSVAVEQPFYYTAAYPSNGATLGGNGSGPPFGNTIWFGTVGNTRITPVLLQWNFANGWSAAAGLTLIPADGSSYNGTLNPDHFTTEPMLSVAYLGESWHVTANLKYDFNAASAGRTGSYQIAANLPFPLGFGGTPLAGIVAGIGNGYQSGQQAYLDLAALYVFGRWEIGPVASFYWQTTADTPGGGFTCAQLAAALPASLGCGRAARHSLGGLVGYDFGPVKFQVWATDSFSTRDEFDGLGIYTRLSFKLWGPDEAPSRLPVKAPPAR